MDYGWGAWFVVSLLIAVPLALIVTGEWITCCLGGDGLHNRTAWALRADGMRWIVLLTAGVGGAALALIEQILRCSWPGVTVVIFGAYWVIGGLAAVLLQTVLLRDRARRMN